MSLYDNQLTIKLKSTFPYLNVCLQQYLKKDQKDTIKKLQIKLPLNYMNWNEFQSFMQNAIKCSVPETEISRSSLQHYNVVFPQSGRRVV